MIGTTPKPVEEIKCALDGFEKVAVVGCDGWYFYKSGEGTSPAIWKMYNIFQIRYSVAGRQVYLSYLFFVIK